MQKIINDEKTQMQERNSPALQFQGSVHHKV